MKHAVAKLGNTLNSVLEILQQRKLNIDNIVCDIYLSQK